MVDMQEREVGAAGRLRGKQPIQNATLHRERHFAASRMFEDGNT